jgi:hypothetical protein
MVKNSFTPIIPQEENKDFLSFFKKIKRVIRKSSRNRSRNSSFSKKKKFYYSVILRTCFQKDNYDSFIRFFLLCSYSDLYNYNLDQEYNLRVSPKIFALMIGYPILIKAFLVLRLEIHEKELEIHEKKKQSKKKKKIHEKDKRYNFLIKDLKKAFSIAQSAYDNRNLEYQRNLKPEEPEKPEEPKEPVDPKDVFAPFGHLWTMCENCETSIYKQYAKKNKYICQHCGYHLRMESFDRIESFIDAGTWDSMDENMVSTDPYEILRKNLAPASDNSSEFMKSQEAK